MTLTHLDTDHYSALRSASDRLLSWTRDKSLPLWLKKGRDPRGAFFERLSLLGSPIEYQRSAVMADRVIAAVDRLFDEHLVDAIPRGWIDERGPEGQALSTSMTAATGYHVYLAAFELAQMTQRLPKRLDKPRIAA